MTVRYTAYILRQQVAAMSDDPNDKEEVCFMTGHNLPWVVGPRIAHWT
jgi:hypothetical protein